MPPIRSSAFKRYALLTASISLNREIISPYSCCIKKGLMYIVIISLAGRQPSFCFKYTKANTYLSYNMRLVFFNKYRFPYYIYYCAY